jgi:uncharacterized protein with PIN domain
MRFIVTNELGRLARWLRIMGFDAVYFKGSNINTLIIEALREDRFIITRRQGKIDDLQKKTLVLNTDKLTEQLRQVLQNLQLKIEESEMFTRCPMCNEMLREAKKEEAKELIPPYVYKTQNEFRQCNSCKRLYWKGSHWGNIKEAISHQLSAVSKNILKAED